MGRLDSCYVPCPCCVFGCLLDVRFHVSIFDRMKRCGVASGMLVCVWRMSDATLAVAFADNRPLFIRYRTYISTALYTQRVTDALHRAFQLYRYRFCYLQSSHAVSSIVLPTASTDTDG